MRPILKKFITPLLSFTLISAALGSLGRITPFGNQVSIYLYEPFLTVSLLTFIGMYGLKPFIKINDTFKPFRIFLLYVYVNYFFLVTHYSFQENIIGFLYLFRLVSYIIFGIYLFHHMKNQTTENHTLHTSLIIFATVTILTGLIQYYLYPDLRNLSYLDWDPHLYRMFGLFFEPFLASAVYGLLIVYLFFKGDRIVKNPSVKYFFLGVLVVMFFLTYSRGAYVGLFFSALFYSVKGKKHLFIGLILITFTVGIVLLPKKFGEGINLLRTSTILTRLKDYDSAIKIWQKNPIIGIGYNRIRYEKIQLYEDSKTSLLRSHAGASFHSSFLIVLVTTGVIGLILFISALVPIMKINDFVLHSTLFLSIFSLTDNVLLHPIVLFLYFVGISLSLNLSDTSL